MAAEFPGLTLKVHAAAEWGENPTALDAARADIARGDLILISLLFLEDHIRAILPDLKARRDHCDAMIGIIADAQIVKLTRMGTLDMAAPETGARKLIKRLRGTDKPSAESGEKKMKMLRRLPRILKYIPGKAQDLRAWFLVMQYWLGTSDDNIEAMLRFLMSRYGHEARFRALRARFVPDERPDPWSVLGVSADMPLSDIRAAWRKQVLDCHPDRLKARGVPEEAVRLAERRLRDINNAWEEISSMRAPS